MPRRLETQIGPRSSRLQNARQLIIRCSNADVNGKVIVRGKCFQQVKIAQDQGGFRHYAELQAAAFRHDLQQASRDPHAPFNRLIRIRCGAHGNFFAWTQLAQFLPQQPCGILLDEDQPLEKLRVAQFHKFVRVAGEAIAAAEFTSPVRIDGFAERKTALGD